MYNEKIFKVLDQVGKNLSTFNDVKIVNVFEQVSKRLSNYDTNKMINVFEKFGKNFIKYNQEIITNLFSGASFLILRLPQITPSALPRCGMGIFKRFTSCAAAAI